MAKCANCGKGNIVGRSVTFSGKHNRRVFRVNLHTQWVPKGNILVKKGGRGDSIDVLLSKRAEFTSGYPISANAKNPTKATKPNSFIK